MRKHRKLSFSYWDVERTLGTQAAAELATSVLASRITTALQKVHDAELLAREYGVAPHIIEAAKAAGTSPVRK